MPAVIYRITNVVTDGFYVGSTRNFRRRRWEHLDQLAKGVHHCAQLQAAYTAYGAAAFEFEVLEEVADFADLARVEDTYLMQWAGGPGCYNTALTSMAPSALAADVALRISGTLKRLFAENPGSHPRLGTTHSAETRAKISAAKRANPVRPWLGKARAEETKRKISTTQKGVKKAPRVYTEAGLVKARENMARNAREQPPMEFAAVLEKFPAEVQARYDFTNAVYTGALERITGIKCGLHGEFSQYSAQLRKGRGCPACGALVRGAKKKVDMLARWADPEQRKAMMDARSGESVDSASPA